MKQAVFNALSGSVAARAAILAPAALAIWWFLLKRASLWALRILATVPLALLVAPPGLSPIRLNPQTGEWMCNVEVNAVTRNQKTGELQHVDSVEIAVQKNDAAFYASGWFSYLALALSTLPFSRKRAKRLSWGLGIQTLLNVVCLAGFIYVVGYEVLAASPGAVSGGLWWIKYFDHINTLVIPFAGPFVIAILLHPEWQQYLGFAPARQQNRQPAMAAAQLAKAKRRRY